ncbi:MAG TPA: prepilin-type N-terminal cleavage/methylation domain-containing protein [Phycisphaerae bacterium]|nr:prepilin-type N-terminal cleavage/methylation domain-containing protein [Phycisphaerae bacterium]HRY67676.1 prepilin-type N-terminal cleavage/methylation domain-containing protein [Phycisphaerae bacterium]HSA25063.1 prepilin-type N-terminal cleavage/methylation domain-containing protein [Phycisphaerae bacterium]
MGRRPARSGCGPRRRSGPRRAGFTLIEVLVVVAIIALLITILIPSLTKAREMAKRSSCLAALHQIGLGLVGYASDHKARLPLRGTYGYNIAEHKSLHYESVPADQKYIKEPINYGMLYGKYVGKDLRLFYCPSTPRGFWSDPTYGIDSFFLHNDKTSYVTWGGYMYAAPVDVGKCPRADSKKVYPSEVWHPYFVDYLAKTKGVDPATYQMPLMQALVADGVIGSSEGQTVMRACHGNGANALYGDYHAKFVQDVKGELRALTPSSGPNGGPALYRMWEFFTLHY